MADPLDALSAEVRRNLRCFLLFRVFFNARFYYPVYTVLFLDHGLTMDQFALLNAAWAASIVLLEVPSGTLADQFGRRTLVVAASVLMVVEMIVLALAPVGGGWACLLLFLVNRIISGAAEASASGADEALAYDSIPPAHRVQVWPRLMSRMMHWQAIAFIGVTILGAWAYDPETVNRAASLLGLNLQLTQSVTIKFPIFLNILTAFLTLAVALQLKEARHPQPGSQTRGALSSSLRRTIATGRWILRSPAPLLLILFGITFDSFIRLFYTVSSNFYRLIDIPERHFGLIGAAGSILALGAAWAVERLAHRTTPTTQFFLVFLLAFAGLQGLAHPVPHYGVVLIVPLWIAMRFLHFFLSTHLNRVTSSEHRATALSFRGLAMNASYGLIMILYGAQTLAVRATQPGADSGSLSVFAACLKWWPWAFLLASAAVWIFLRIHCRGRSLTRLVEEGAQAVGKTA